LEPLSQLSATAPKGLEDRQPGLALEPDAYLTLRGPVDALSRGK
jgi:hypothetical protein